MMVINSSPKYLEYLGVSMFNGHLSRVLVPPNRSQVGGLEHEFYFSISWECHHPNWRTPSFFRGVGQLPTRINWILEYQTTLFDIDIIKHLLWKNGKQGLVSSRVDLRWLGFRQGLSRESSAKADGSPKAPWDNVGMSVEDCPTIMAIEWGYIEDIWDIGDRRSLSNRGKGLVNWKSAGSGHFPSCDSLMFAKLQRTLEETFLCGC